MKHPIDQIVIDFSTFGNTGSKCYTVRAIDMFGEEIEYGLPMGKDEVLDLLKQLIEDGTYEDYKD